MEKHIEDQLEGHKPGEIFELNLDSCDIKQISGLTDEFINLETLTLANNSLTSLKGFPTLPNLRKLDLCDNHLSDGLEALQNCQNLEYLILSSNQFKDLASLEPLKKLKALQYLELFNCPVADIDDYRSKVTEMFEGVMFIDGLDRAGNPAPNDEDDEGDYDGGDDEDHGSEDDEGDSELEGEGHDDGDEEDDEDDGGRGTKRKHDDDDDDDDDDA